MDFILERYDGFHDLLELKSPQDPIVVAPDAVDDVPPPAHDFALSPDLAQALAPGARLSGRSIGGRSRGVKALRPAEYAQPKSVHRHRQSAALPSHRALVLRDLNLTLHRMEVVPYDVLGQRAETMLNNVERHLSASKSEE